MGWKEGIKKIKELSIWKGTDVLKKRGGRFFEKGESRRVGKRKVGLNSIKNPQGEGRHMQKGRTIFLLRRGGLVFQAG